MLALPQRRVSEGSAPVDADLGIDVDQERLAAVCRRYGIAVLRVFGSAARGTATASSDLDLLYELAPGVRLGWEIDDLAQELEEVFGRPVDPVSRVALHPLLARSVLDEARPLYAA
jgi:hypothetical protein